VSDAGSATDTDAQRSAGRGVIWQPHLTSRRSHAQTL
jgi:hypothetical protein